MALSGRSRWRRQEGREVESQKRRPDALAPSQGHRGQSRRESWPGQAGYPVDEPAHEPAAVQRQDHLGGCARFGTGAPAAGTSRGAFQSMRRICRRRHTLEAIQTPVHPLAPCFLFAGLLRARPPARESNPFSAAGRPGLTEIRSRKGIGLRCSRGSKDAGRARPGRQLMFTPLPIQRRRLAARSPLEVARGAVSDSRVLQGWEGAFAGNHNERPVRRVLEDELVFCFSATG